MALRVVIIGGGFAGLYAAKALGHAPVEVTVIDRRNSHLFQPLLYQAATGALSPGEIASPLRCVLRKHQNTRVWLAEVTDIDVHKRQIALSEGHVAAEKKAVACRIANGVLNDGIACRPVRDGLVSVQDGIVEAARKFVAV